MNRLLILSFAFVLFTGCNGRDEHKYNTAPIEPCTGHIEVNCTLVSPILGFDTSFTKTDVNTIILKRYKYDDNFNTFIDSTTYDSSDIFTSGYSGGTRVFHRNAKISDRYDYRVILPTTNNIFELHSTKAIPTTMSVPCHQPGPYCAYRAEYVLVDGVQTIVAPLGILGTTSISFSTVEKTKLSYLLIK